MTTTAHATHVEAGRRVFTRVLVGIDGSQQALEAARQAARLLDENGELTLLAAWHTAPTIVGGTGTGVPYYFDEELQVASLRKALAAARDEIAPYAEAAVRLVNGTPVAELLSEVEHMEDTLVAVGNSGTGRLHGIVTGAVATEIVHKAPCSVLVARRVEGAFPRRVVVGVDGSPESATAYAAASYLTERFGADLRAVVARGGKGVEERLAAAVTGGRHDDLREPPAEALAAAAKTADLVVVGSRGLHGMRALGSTSEQVAHGAPCSVLVVREPIPQEGALR